MYPDRREIKGRRRPSADDDSERRRETRNEETRHQTRLPFSLSILDEQADTHDAPPIIKLMGHTHDINSNSLSLVGPLIRFGYRYLMGRSHILRIALYLPFGPIEIEALPNRYLELEAGATDAGFIMTGGGALMDNNQTEICCLIGVFITKMSKAHRALYDEYLDQLGQVEAEQMSFIVGIEDNLSEEAFLVHN
ncbi:MAG TPA: hypothetical protein VGO91_15340 [Pyrinomonadaceae bacterium]|jgi:hypothetical protein|nr:hypothetical protein [Pyrinomonadaceae bacterium]